jgi:hypothetical protein
MGLKEKGFCVGKWKWKINDLYFSRLGGIEFPGRLIKTGEH